MNTPDRRRRLPSRLPRAIVLCLLGGVLVGAFTEWPVWLGAVVVVGAGVLLSGLLTGDRPRRDGGRPTGRPGT